MKLFVPCRLSAAALPRGQEARGRARHPAGLAAQAGQRGAYAVEKALVRPLRLLPLLLQG